MARTTGRVLTVNVVYQIVDGPLRRTAIDKRPVEGPVHVGTLGLDGDTQCDGRSHGGPDQAVYAYAAEDSTGWAELLGRELPPGVFGENLTTGGLDVNGAEVGERWRVGDPSTGPLFEVRSARTPCQNLSARLGLPGFHQRFAADGTTGAMLRVVETGVVRGGDPVTVVHRPGHGVTLRDLSIGPTPDQMRRLLSAGIDLTPKVRNRARRAVQRSAAALPEA
jgi:MOSC domain-containing protein YiiM